MTLPLDRILHGLHRFERGVFQLNGPVSPSDLEALESRVPSPLTAIWGEILASHDGFDLRGDRYFGAAECLARWARWQRDEGVRYQRLPGWHAAAPDHLLPISADLEGNLKLIDLGSGAVWDWHATSGGLTLWFSSVENLLCCTLEALSARFDLAGRPRSVASRHGGSSSPAERLAHVKFEPLCPYAQVELGRWCEVNSTPEDALACYRRGYASPIPMFEAAYQLGRFCIHTGRLSEARRALRYAISLPTPPNPMQHLPPQGMLQAAHRLLSELYQRNGQSSLSKTHKQAADQALKDEGPGWYGHSDELAQVMDILHAR